MRKEKNVQGLVLGFMSGSLSRMTRVLAHGVCCRHTGKGEKMFWV